jgi:hypothetical protein
VQSYQYLDLVTGDGPGDVRNQIAGGALPSLVGQRPVVVLVEQDELGRLAVVVTRAVSTGFSARDKPSAGPSWGWCSRVSGVVRSHRWVFGCAPTQPR